MTAQWLRVPGLGDAIAAARHRRQGGQRQPQGSRRDPAARSCRHRDLVRRRTGRAAWTEPSRRRRGSPSGTRRTRSPRTSTTCGRRSPETARLAGVPDDAPGEVGEKGFGADVPARARRHQGPRRRDLRDAARQRARARHRDRRDRRASSSAPTRTPICSSSACRRTTTSDTAGATNRGRRGTPCSASIAGSTSSSPISTPRSAPAGGR